MIHNIGESSSTVLWRKEKSGYVALVMHNVVRLEDFSSFSIDCF